MSDLFTDMREILAAEATANPAAGAAGVEQGPDLVNSPAHYTDGGIEAIDYIEAKLSPEEFSGYCRGNALKYLSRAGRKGDHDTDLAKARWYINRLLGM